MLIPAWAAGFYLHGQVEAGSLCPATMTQAAVPVLQKEPALWAQMKDQLLSTEYDALPFENASRCLPHSSEPSPNDSSS